MKQFTRLYRNLAEQDVLNYVFRVYGDNQEGIMSSDFTLLEEDISVSKSFQEQRSGNPLPIGFRG